MKHITAGPLPAPFLRLMLALLLTLSSTAIAQPGGDRGQACLDSNNARECGWFWGHLDDDEEEEPEEPPVEIPMAKAPEEELDCTDPEQATRPATARGAVHESKDDALCDD